MSLVAKNVSLTVNNQLLIANISAEFSAGEFVTIVGENGAGKSTLLNALAGELTLSHGEVWLNQLQMHSMPIEQRALHRAVLPQSSELTFPLSAFEVVRLALSFSSYPIHAQERLLSDCLALFGADQLAHRNYLTLSGGEQQRVQLARVVAQLKAHEFAQLGQPQFLLLDEPISALDLHQQYNTLAQLKQLAQQGFGIITILHDLNLAAMMSDRILILRQGQLFTLGSPAQTFTEDNIRHAFDIEAQVIPHPDTHTPFIIPRIS